MPGQDLRLGLPENADACLRCGRTSSMIVVMNLLLIVADLGRVKAYRLTRNDDDPQASPAFQDLLDDDLENQHSRVGARVTDQAGQFPSGPSGMAAGERHSEEEEARQNQLQSIASVINGLAAREDGPIYLAAPQTMLRQLLEALDGRVRPRVKMEVPRGLVKTPKLELLKRFDLA